MDVSGRTWLIWSGCLPARAGLAVAVMWLAHAKPPGAMPIVAALLLVPAVGFGGQWLLGGRTRGAFGGPVWWGHARLAHAVLYLAAAVLCVWRGDVAGLVLLADVVLGAALAIALQPRPVFRTGQI